jgi:hypothetical protein
MSRHHVRHLVEKTGAHGPRWFWQPSAKLRAQGWRAQRLGANTLAEAVAQAEALNAELDTWREQQGAEGRPKKRAPAGTVLALIADYKASKWHTQLAPRTARDYGHYLDAIATWAGDMPARAITPRAVQAFHDAMASRTEGKGRARRTISTPSRAAAAVRVLSALLGAGVRLGYVASNAASRPGLSVARQREPVLWTAAMVDHMVATADRLGWHSQGTAMLLNSWCGQRQADVLALPPYSLATGAIVLRQGKRGRKVALPVHLVPHLVARLEADRQRPGTLASTTHLLLHEGTGRPWQGFTFTHVFADIRAEAAKTMPACADLRWMELRHSAVTMLHQAGVDALGISTITGHSPATVQAILDKHYLIRTKEGAEAAFKARMAKEGGQ